MRTIVILISLAVSCYGTDDLLEIIFKDNSIRFNEHTNQHVDTSEEVFEPPNIIARGNSAPINELTNQLEDMDGEDFQSPKNPNLNHTYFCPMSKSRQHKATAVNEDQYPWVARVFHSRDQFHPFLCTAAAVKTSVFVTAARCIATAKCGYTSVEYRSTRMLCKALVLPTKQACTRQLYNSIGFIVVHGVQDLSSISFSQMNSTFLDERRGIEHAAYTVVGYIADARDPTRQQLYALRDVLVSNLLCSQILTARNGSDDYHVPCFHSCSPRQYFSKDPACDAHMAGLGHAVLSTNNGSLIGVATWACKNSAAHRQPTPLPVGLALTYDADNTTLADQLQCAERIVEDLDGFDYNYDDNNTRYATYCIF